MGKTNVQAGRAIPVVPSDTIDIANPASRIISSAATATTANKLVDSAGAFTTTYPVAIGDIIINTTDNTTATVTAIDSATTLSISANIMADTETYEIFRKKGDGYNLYIGGAGNISVVVGGDTRVFTGIIGGTFFPVHVTRVNSTLTTCTSIIALT